MNRCYFLSSLFGAILFIFSCQQAPAPEENIEADTTSEMTYDSSLARQLGADDYGMKKYVMAFLKTGPHVEKDSAKRAEIMRGHFDNIKRMADDGKLVIAGPFLDGTELRGIYVFDVATIEEAKVLTESDPAVKAGVFIMELHPWYGSAAACLIGKEHKKIAKKEI